jgi:hypothetical protein
MRGELGGEVGLSFAEGVEPVTVAADAVLEEIGREPSVFEGLEVALQLALDARNVGSRRSELLLQFGALTVCRRCEVGECLFDSVAVAIQLGELGRTTASSRSLGSRSPLHLVGPYL